VTPPTAFLAYLDALPGTVLSPEFRQRIATRERRGEYPFSRQNIYRVLFAAAPVLRRGWLTAAGQRPLDPADPALGTSLRCFRYLHAVLIDPSAADWQTAATLEPIAARAMRLTSRPACFCPPGATPAGVDVPVDLALRLATALRQYADLRWLGQHDQGFVGKPPSRSTEGQVTYARCFSRLPPAVAVASLEVSVTYLPPAGTETGFDYFRGEMTLPPPRGSARAARIVIHGGTTPPDEPLVRQLLATVITAVREAPAAQPATVAQAETAVAGLFSRELCDVSAARGLDPSPWRAEIAARLPTAAPRAESLTEAYLDTLTRSVTAWREIICAGN
jgi:hypothetical protein